MIQTCNFILILQKNSRNFIDVIEIVVTRRLLNSSYESQQRQYSHENINNAYECCRKYSRKKTFYSRR